jgi:hypothetical protein
MNLPSIEMRMAAAPQLLWNMYNSGVERCFVMFVGNNFLWQTVSFGICQGVVF